MLRGTRSRRTHFPFRHVGLLSVRSTAGSKSEPVPQELEGHVSLGGEGFRVDRSRPDHRRVPCAQRSGQGVERALYEYVGIRRSSAAHGDVPLRIDQERDGLYLGLEGPGLWQIASDHAAENSLQVRFQLSLDLGAQAVEEIGNGTHDLTGRCRCIINFEIRRSSFVGGSLATERMGSKVNLA